MSKATFTPAKTETKTIEVEPAKVTLELTVSQAGTLLSIHHVTGGYPNGRRGDMEAIAQALRSVGIERPSLGYSVGQVYFKDGHNTFASRR